MSFGDGLGRKSVFSTGISGRFLTKTRRMTSTPSFLFRARNSTRCEWSRCQCWLWCWNFPGFCWIYWHGQPGWRNSMSNSDEQSLQINLAWSAKILGMSVKLPFHSPQTTGQLDLWDGLRCSTILSCPISQWFWDSTLIIFGWSPLMMPKAWLDTVEAMRGSCLAGSFGVETV